MAKGTQQPIVTKKHLARVERERRQNRIILGASIAIIILVVGLLSYGSIQQYIIQPRQPVAQVGDDSITTHEFQAYARYLRFQYIQQYAQYASFAQMFGTSSEETQSYLAQYWSQVNYQLEPNTLGQSVLDQVINFSLAKQYAEENDITISEDEIDKAVEEFFGYSPAGTPTVAPTREIQPTSTLSAFQMTLVPPTATSTPLPTEAITETLTITPTVTLAPTATQAPTATASGPTPTTEPLPTATEYTQDAYEENFNNYIDYLSSDVGISADDLRWIIEMRLYQDEVYEIITADVPESQDQVWVRHIVVADEEAAQTVLDRLQNGEDFAFVAFELSTDSTTNTLGGDMGWFGTGVKDQMLESVAFSLRVGQINEPIQTTAGWEIIQVLGHEVRQLTDDEYNQARSTAFQLWLDQQRDLRDVQVFDIWTERVPAVPTLPPLGQ
jgi:peptidyl-prolyl cis-trans isomerase D